MKRMAKGDFYIRREEVLDFLSLPEDAEFIATEFDEDGNLKITVLTQDEIKGKNGANVTWEQTGDKSRLIRKRFTSNPHRSLDKKDW